MGPFRNGIVTGLILQLAIGPVFFFIINLTLQRTILDGLAGVLAVTTVDYFYIALAILGVGKLLEHKKTKRIFGFVSSIVLAVFGVLIIKDAAGAGLSSHPSIAPRDLFSSFTTVFILTISSPMTIVFFTSLFAAKAVEHNYARKALLIFGVGTGLATLLFMGTSVILFSLLKGAIPVPLITILNVVVGGLLIGYGGFRLVKPARSNTQAAAVQ